MNGLKKWLLLAATVAPMAAFVAGCSSSSSTSSGGGSTTQTVDLAVMDRDYNNDLIYQVMLWFDVLANPGPGLPPPNVILDTGNRSPVDGMFYNGDLYVAATNNGTAPQGGVLIYRNYLSAASGAAPDVVLSGATDVIGPLAAERLALDNDVLVSCTWYGSGISGDSVSIWNNATGLADGADPDVVINGVSTGLGVNFTEPTDVVLVGPKLYVGVYNGLLDATQVGLAIFNDVLSAGSSAPDVAFTDDTNFLNLGQYVKHITVANDILYVAGESGGAGGNAPYVFIFNGADSLTSSSLPDNVLIGTIDGSGDDAYIESPGRIVVDSNNFLWVANKNEDDTPNNNPAVSGFGGANALVLNQPPSVTIGQASGGPAQAERVLSVGGALFITGSPENEDGWDRKGIYIYRDAAGVASGDGPSLAAMGDDDVTLAFMRFPTGIAATVRGTTDNFND